MNACDVEVEGDDGNRVDEMLNEAFGSRARDRAGQPMNTVQQLRYGHRRHRDRLVIVGVAKLLRIENVDGHEHHVLELVAAARGVTYPKVVYWVRADNHHPHKAEFYAVSGRLLKTCTYENFEKLGGQVRPTRLVMTDAVKTGDQSTLDYSELELRELPDRMFTKDYMKRLD